ncbi:hypothetical protein AYO38_07120 [bacterium SCGC AG-212-C10]|nr:hypothetical protein AYO38_07120 [bacterium SCGC AG-212-C10]
MSRDEFLAWDHPGVAEWVDGKVFVDMSVGLSHERVVRFVKNLLLLFVDHAMIGEIAGEPYSVECVPGGRLREPDIFFVSTDRQHLLTEQFLAGPPDLAVEVLSPSSVARDLEEKFLEFAAAGVREYWVLDPRDGRRVAYFFVLAPDPVTPGAMAFRPVPISEDGTYRSTVLDGFWMRVAWAFDGARPGQCLAEILAGEPAPLADR